MAVIVSAFGGVFLSVPYRVEKLAAAFLPLNYHVMQAQEVIRNAKFWGAAQGGMVYLILNEEIQLPLRLTASFGLISLIVLGVLLIWLAVSSMRILTKQKNQLARMTCTAALWVVVLQSAGNLLWNAGFPFAGEFGFPILTGYAVMIVNMAPLGILLAAFRLSPIDKAEPPKHAGEAGRPVKSLSQIDGSKIILDFEALKK